MSVFTAFSHCLFFARGGRTVYLGPTSSIQTYLEGVGFPMPLGENIADFTIDVIDGQVPRIGRDGEPDRNFVPEEQLPIMWTSSMDAPLTFSGEIFQKDVSIDAAHAPFDCEDARVLMQLEHELKKMLGSFKEELTVADIGRLCRLKHIDVGQGDFGGVEDDTENMYDTGFVGTESRRYSGFFHLICNLAPRFSAKKDSNPVAIYQGLHAQLCENLPAGERLTVDSFIRLLKASHGTGSVNSGGDTDAVDTKPLKDRPAPSFWSQLGTLCSRNLAKFNFSNLFVQLAVCIVAACIVGPSHNGALIYPEIPNTAQGGIIIFSIIVPGISIL
jgi:hypothetical protein